MEINFLILPLIYSSFLLHSLFPLKICTIVLYIKRKRRKLDMIINNWTDISKYFSKINSYHFSYTYS